MKAKLMNFNKKYSKLVSLLLLTVIPISIFFISAAFKKSQGAAYYGNFYDPDYCYLINSLNLAQFNGYGVGHIDHPGTPVQMIGALMILLKYNLGISNNELYKDVLENPNEYINFISKALILLLCLSLLFLGYTVYRIYKNILLSILFQLPCFIASIQTYSLIKVGSDSFIMFTASCLVILIFFYIRKSNFHYSGHDYFFILGFSALIGLGIATKLTYIPLAVIPLFLITGIKKKLIYFFLSIFFFLIFVSPALSKNNISYFRTWISELTTQGGYMGQQGTIFSTILKNFSIIISGENFFITIYFLIFITFIISILIRKKIPIKKNIQFRLLTGVFIAITLQLLLVTRQFNVGGIRYLIPAFMLSILGIYLVINFFAQLFNPKFKKFFLNICYCVSIILVMIIGIKYIKHRMYVNSYFRIECEKFVSFIDENYPDAVRIFTYSVSSQEFALYYGTNYAGTQTARYKSFLSSKFPSTLYFGHPVWKCLTFEGSADIKNIISSKEKVIFMCNNEENLTNFVIYMKTIPGYENISLEKKFTNSVVNESVYEIR